MWTPDSPEVSRSLGWQNLAEQEAKFAGSVCIAGLGGAGYLTGLSLVRDGVQRINVAELDEISSESINRITDATTKTVGIPKLDLFAQKAREINPDVEIKLFSDGVTKDNVSEFVHGMDVAFDGIDLNVPHVTAMFAREVRASGIPMVSGMEIGPSAMITSFHPHTGKTFEKMAGYDEDEPLDEIEAKAKEGIPLSHLIPYLPYKSGDTRVLKAVMDGAPLPSNAEGTNLYASIAGHELGLHLTSGVNNHRENPVWAPNYYVVDNSRRYAGVLKASSFNFYKYVLMAAGREKLGLNPRADYAYALEANNRREAATLEQATDSQTT